MMPLLLILAGLSSYLTRPSLVSLPEESLNTETRTVRIGTKNFTEQLILGEILAQLIEAKTTLAVERRFNLGGTMICHGALVNGEIDLYPEYTGTGLTAILKHHSISDQEEVFGIVKQDYREHFGVQWLKPFGFNNTYAITVRKSEVSRFGWVRISDLENAAPRLRAGFTAEFAERPDGYPGLRKAYGFGFGQVRDLDPALMYTAISKREVDVICAFATDGRIAFYNLKPLKDDLNFFPPYHAAPVIREETLRAYPELKNVLSLLEGLLDNETMMDLNFKVDAKKRRVAEVAKEFLIGRGLH